MQTECSSASQDRCGGTGRSSFEPTSVRRTVCHKETLQKMVSSEQLKNIKLWPLCLLSSIITRECLYMAGSTLPESEEKNEFYIFSSHSHLSSSSMSPCPNWRHQSHSCCKNQHCWTGQIEDFLACFSAGLTRCGLRQGIW